MKNTGYVLLRWILVLVVFATAAAALQKAQPQPAVLTGKTVTFITFAADSEATQLKNVASAFFMKWKRYQILDDPTKADLLILLGPMPRHVSGDAFDAVLAGRKPEHQVDVAGAQSQFAVFDGAEVHGDVPVNGTLKPLWSAEMNGHDLKQPARKYKQLVENLQEDYDHMGLSFEKCRIVGMRCSH